MSAKFFVRFYAKTEQEVQQFIDEYRALVPSCLSATAEPLAKSINLVVPPSSWEVNLFFASAQARTAAYANLEGRRLYMKHATPTGVQGKFAERKPGDAAFQHKG